jgi:protein phosphatase PTC1
MCEESEGKIHSGCTAVTALIRIEDADGHQSYLNTPPSPTADSPISQSSVDAEELGSGNSSGESIGNVSPDGLEKSKSKKSPSRLRRALRTLAGSGSSSSKNSISQTPRSASPAASRKSTAVGTTITIPPVNVRRVLYTANAGDARGVLCRAGKAVRLTYDHKGSDKQEAKRITDAGGFVMSGRVNGVLAVTRSLGDSAMKEFVVGAPYTTETELCDEDEFLVLACDGVSRSFTFSIHVIVWLTAWSSFGT